MAEFQFTITLQVERVEGKFASNDEISERIQEQLESLDFDLDGLGADGESTYEVVESDVDGGAVSRRRKQA